MYIFYSTESQQKIKIFPSSYVAVEALLDAGADPNFSTIVFSPFMHAASKGHTKVMFMLLELLISVFSSTWLS